MLNRPLQERENTHVKADKQLNVVLSVYA